MSHSSTISAVAGTSRSQVCDAAQLGIGAMTEARWKKNYDFMVESGLLSPSTEWRKAYTTRFIDDLKVMP